LKGFPELRAFSIFDKEMYVFVGQSFARKR